MEQAGARPVSRPPAPGRGLCQWCRNNLRSAPRVPTPARQACHARNGTADHPQHIRLFPRLGGDHIHSTPRITIITA